MASVFQQSGLLIPKRFQHQLLFGGKKGVEEGFGDTDFLAQDINAAVYQSTVRDAPERRAHQGNPYLLAVLLRISFPRHRQSSL